MKKTILAVGIVLIVVVLFIVTRQKVAIVEDVSNTVTNNLPSPVVVDLNQSSETFSGNSLLIEPSLASVILIDGKKQSCFVNKTTRFFTKSLGAIPQVGDIVVATYDATVSKVEAMVLSRNTDLGLFRTVHSRKDTPLNIVVGTVASVKEGSLSVKKENNDMVDIFYDEGINVVLDDWQIKSPVPQHLRAEMSCVEGGGLIAQIVTLYK